VTTTSTFIIDYAEHREDCRGDDELCDYMYGCVHYQEYLIEGDLADVVREKFEDPDGRVILKEGQYYTGYSECTITSEYQSITVQCGEKEVKFVNTDGWDEDPRVSYQVGRLDPIACLMKWLEQ
jgi:hypothetical protein